MLQGSVDDAYSYCKEGRVEYYYDKEDNLLYIKVVDLTEAEYEYLSHWID